jgi:hypothetical protein
MDGESKTKDRHRLSTKDTVNDGNVLQPTWIRRAFLFSSEVDQFILDYNFTFLPGISVLLWYVFLISEAL